jgi:hypothetical protein
MSATITCDLDMRAFRANVVGTRRVIEAGTARAVRIALNEGADYARTHHVHKKRTGHLTSKETLRGEMRQANSSGAWGYLLNDAKYVRHVEFGTKAHDIWPKAGHGSMGPLRSGQSRRATGKGPHEHIVGRGLMLRFKIGGRVVFARMVKHPGTPAMAFMHPAADHARKVIIRETEAVTFARAAAVWE